MTAPVVGYVANIQALRGIAALFVLALHVIFFSQSEYYGVPLRSQIANDVAHYMGFGVDIFFIISGFVMHATTGHARGGLDARRFIVSRIVRIYPLYWVLSLPLITWFLLKHGVNRDLIMSMLLLPHSGVDVSQVAWTLEYEMYFYIIYALLIVLLGHRARLWAMTVLFLFLSGVGYVGSFAKDSAAAFFTSPYILEFLMGAWVAHAVQSGNIKISAAVLGLALFLCFSFPLFILYGQYSYGHPVVGACAAVIVWSCCVLERSHALKAPQILMFWGNRSYSLYLIHVPVLLVAAKTAGFFPAIPFFMVVPCAALLALLFAHIAHEMIEKKIILRLRFQAR